MNNVFPVGFEIQYTFVLKGSTVNMFVPPEKKEQSESTWKEAEFERKRYLQLVHHD
jgi:hypothetical protein